MEQNSKCVQTNSKLAEFLDYEKQFSVKFIYNDPVVGQKKEQIYEEIEYDFSKNRPLVFDQIIHSAHRNKGQITKIPGTGWGNCVEYDMSAEDFLESISAEKIVEFNEMNIMLHDMSRIKIHFSEGYLEKLRGC